MQMHHSPALRPGPVKGTVEKRLFAGWVAAEVAVLAIQFCDPGGIDGTKRGIGRRHQDVIANACGDISSGADAEPAFNQ